MKTITEEKFQHNSDLLKIHWKEELEYRLNEVEQLIKDDFYTGIWGFLFNRLVAVVYSFFLSKDIKDKILAQGDILLDASRDYTGDPDVVIEKYFEDFLLVDPSWERAKKKHSKSSELKERYKRSFILLVEETQTLLYSEGSSYEELFRNAYKNKDEAKRATFAILETAEEDLDFAVKHKMIKVNRLIRDPIIKILYKELEIGKGYYDEKISKAFDEA